jgi:hypothetical protein
VLPTEPSRLPEHVCVFVCVSACAVQMSVLVCRAGIPLKATVLPHLKYYQTQCITSIHQTHTTNNPGEPLGLDCVNEHVHTQHAGVHIHTHTQHAARIYRHTSITNLEVLEGLAGWRGLLCSVAGSCCEASADLQQPVCVYVCVCACVHMFVHAGLFSLGFGQSFGFADFTVFNES